MKEYVVQSGMLRTFDGLYDARFEKMRRIADYHCISITAKPTTQRIVIDRMNRSSELEIRFVSSLFSALAGGAHVIFGLLDITAGRASELAQKLGPKQSPRWTKLSYGPSEDDLALVELKRFSEEFRLVQPYVPPKEGVFFCYLTAASFDVFTIYWERACLGSQKAKDDHFRRDLMTLAPEAKITIWEDAEGSFTLLLHPSIEDTEAVEREITHAGQKAGMSITFAPGLFG